MTEGEKSRLIYGSLAFFSVFHRRVSHRLMDATTATTRRFLRAFCLTTMQYGAAFFLSFSLSFSLSLSRALFQSMREPPCVDDVFLLRVCIKKKTYVLNHRSIALTDATHRMVTSSVLPWRRLVG